MNKKRKIRNENFLNKFTSVCLWICLLRVFPCRQTHHASQLRTFPQIDFVEFAKDITQSNQLICAEACLFAEKYFSIV